MCFRYITSVSASNVEAGLVFAERNFSKNYCIKSLQKAIEMNSYSSKRVMFTFIHFLRQNIVYFVVMTSSFEIIIIVKWEAFDLADYIKNKMSRSSCRFILWKKLISFIQNLLKIMHGHLVWKFVIVCVTWTLYLNEHLTLITRHL